MQNDHDMKTLNGSIETILDSSDGYAEAANDADSEPLIQLFRTRSSEPPEVASSLQQCMRRTDVERGEETILASREWWFVDLRTNLTSGHDKIVMDEVDPGEDHVMEQFENAMNDADVSPQTKSAIASAYAYIRTGRDRMSELKHALNQ